MYNKIYNRNQLYMKQVYNLQFLSRVFVKESLYTRIVVPLILFY